MSSKLEKNAVWEGNILCTLLKQLFVHPKPIPASVRLEGQTAIITGANSGLGFEASRQLLQLGLSHLVVAVRSQKKGEDAAGRLQAEFPGARVEVSVLDMADYDSIVAFTQRCQGLETIDYAVLNAAAQNPRFERNDRTDHEAVFQTNYLSTALLTLLLAAIMREKKRKSKSQSSRVPVLSVVGSDAMYSADVATSLSGSSSGSWGSVFEFMDDPARFAKLPQYANSKLLLMMFVARLAEKTSPKDVIISVCNPGHTGGTGLGQVHDSSGSSSSSSGFVERYLLPIFERVVARPTHVGASVYTHALLMETEESHGSFVSDWAIKPYAPVMYTPEGRSMIDRLWDETVDELGLSSSVWET
ncbi:hypothetical protein F5X96DRAFT_618943 [Biscogniauxia mediterranea]|nr:hypothetical protein F5X96DRAFT_618943 [Biscogniauxia mediterranea]